MFQPTPERSAPCHQGQLNTMSFVQDMKGRAPWPKAGFPRGLESLEKPWILKNKYKAWNSLEHGQIGLRALKIIKWTLKIFKSALKFSKTLKFAAVFAPHPAAWLCTHELSSRAALDHMDFFFFFFYFTYLPWEISVITGFHYLPANKYNGDVELHIQNNKTIQN